VMDVPTEREPGLDEWTPHHHEDNQDDKRRRPIAPAAKCHRHSPPPSSCGSESRHQSTAVVKGAHTSNESPTSTSKTRTAAGRSMRWSGFIAGALLCLTMVGKAGTPGRAALAAASISIGTHDAAYAMSV